MKTAFLILALLWSAIWVGAQEPPKPSAEDVIKIDTTLVQVRAVVTDRSGQVVDNLKKDDFEILENGKPQRIGFFSPESISAVAASVPDATAKSTPSKPPTVSEKSQRTVVLFVDTLQLNGTALVRAKEQLKEFIDQRVTEEDSVAVVTTTNSLGILNQFMRDRRMLKRAIDKISGFGQTSSFFTPFLAAKVLSEAPTAIDVATAIVRVEDGLEVPRDYVYARAREVLSAEEIKRRATWETLKGVVDRIKEMPRQRMIAFVSDGFTLLNRDSGLDNEELIAATSQAARAGVVIYSFFPQGLTGPAETDIRAPLATPDFSAFMAQSLADQQNTLRSVAADTGGEAYLNSNDMVGQLQKMVDANRIYYAIAYYPEDREQKKFRNIKVRSKDHPDYKVRTQRGLSIPG